MKAEFLRIKIADYNFVINVANVKEISVAQKIYPVPLTKAEVLGSTNFHGKIVLALDTRMMLGIEKATRLIKTKFIVVDYRGELFALVVDDAGMVISIAEEELSNDFKKLDPSWQKISSGILSIEDDLIVILDVNKLISILF